MERLIVNVRRANRKQRDSTMSKNLEFVASANNPLRPCSSAFCKAIFYHVSCNEPFILLGSYHCDKHVDIMLYLNRSTRFRLTTSINLTPNPSRKSMILLIGFNLPTNTGALVGIVPLASQCTDYFTGVCIIGDEAIQLTKTIQIPRTNFW